MIKYWIHGNMENIENIEYQEWEYLSGKNENTVINERKRLAEILSQSLSRF